MTGDVPTGRGLVCSPPHGYPYGGDLPRGDLDVGRLPRGNGNLDVLTVTVGRPSLGTCSPWGGHPRPHPHDGASHRLADRHHGADPDRHHGAHPDPSSPSPAAVRNPWTCSPWVPTARPLGTIPVGNQVATPARRPSPWVNVNCWFTPARWPPRGAVTGAGETTPAPESSPFPLPSMTGDVPRGMGIAPILTAFTNSGKKLFSCSFYSKIRSYVI